MQIRQATMVDALLLAELNRTVQQLHHEHRPEIFKPPQITDSLLDFYRDILSQPGNHIFIGEVNGQAVGYVYAKVLRRPENPFTHALDYLLIDQISVNAGQQGKGYGQALMQATYDLARKENLTRVILNVWEFNAGAVDFYRKQGFHTLDEKMERILP